MLFPNDPYYPNLNDAKIDCELSRMRDAIATGIKDIIKRNGYTHACAAERTGFGRTVVTAVVNDNLDKISTERLLKMGSRIGLKITVQIS